MVHTRHHGTALAAGLLLAACFGTAAPALAATGKARPAQASSGPSQADVPTPKGPKAGRRTSARASSGWHLTGEALTVLPAYVGAKFHLEAPYRIRASIGAGVLPGAYVDLINAVVVAAGGYDEDTAKVIRSSLKTSMVLRFHVGWRPFRNYGFVVEAGYGLVALGGDVATEDLLAVVTGATPPRQPVARRDYDVTSTLHMVDVELSYRWVLGPGVVLRVGVGFAGTVAAQSKVTPRYTPILWSPVRTFTRAAEDYLDDTYTSYVFTPTVTVAVGWRPL